MLHQEQDLAKCWKRGLVNGRVRSSADSLLSFSLLAQGMVLGLIKNYIHKCSLKCKCFGLTGRRIKDVRISAEDLVNAGKRWAWLGPPFQQHHYKPQDQSPAPLLRSARSAPISWQPLIVVLLIVHSKYLIFTFSTEGHFKWTSLYWNVNNSPSSPHPCPKHQSKGKWYPGLLTCVPCQGIIWSTASQTKSLGNLTGTTWPSEKFWRFDFSSKFCPNHPQQDNGCGLLPSLFIGCRYFFHLWETRQTT